MFIRQEQPEDHNAIYQMIKTAFETAKVKDGDEQDFANRLRAGNKYIHELALVAEENGSIVGHIMLTRTAVLHEQQRDQQEQGEQNFAAVLLAPLAVDLKYRNKGVGGQLVTTALNLARNMGYTAVFIAGDPAYYGRFGFVSTRGYNIRCTLDVPEAFIDCIMVCELVPNALHGISGLVDFDG